MNISVQKLLGKIEEELRQAKSTNDEARLRERIHAMKTLCELVLEEPTEPQHFQKTAISMQPVSQPLNIQPQKMKLDEEANGDSLFDF